MTNAGLDKLYHPLFKWFHSSQLFNKVQNYISVCHRKQTLFHFKRLLKQLYCFERCLATNRNKICKKENETITKFKNVLFPSLIDIQMSFAMCLGDIMHD